MTSGELVLNSQLSAAFVDGVQYAWSSTTIKMAETCLRKYQYEMIEGWHSPHLSAHLKFGQEYATAIEYYYKMTATGIEPDIATREVVRAALIATWEYEVDEAGQPVPGTGHPWRSDHNLKNRENLVRSIIWYLDHFAEDQAKPIILSDGKPAVELSVSIEVDNGILFTAHLDRLAEYIDNPYVMDQKTTGTTISTRYFEQYSPDTQMSMYTFLGKAAFGVPVKGVIIDAAQVAVGFTRFERGMTYRTEGQLNEWYDDTMRHILAAQAATRENYFPMNRSSCGNYGGCQFRAVCSRDPGARKNFLAADFVRGGGYDPLERR